MKILIATILISAASFIASVSGCKTGQPEQIATRDTNVYAVVVGMENSKYAGRCDGAGYDAERMYKLLSNYTSNIVKFSDNAATKANVVAALKDAVAKANNGLVIFSYSGHGGSDPFPDTGIDEDDGKDEYLLLWDTYLRDNEIWSIISKSNGRVFILADACHSQSIMRESGFKLKLPLAWDHKINETQHFSLLCWSGCPDDSFSYGSSSGGQFTNALLRHFDQNDTYESLWEKIKNDRTLRSYENPQSTVIGNGFNEKEIFR